MVRDGCGRDGERNSGVNDELWGVITCIYRHLNPRAIRLGFVEPKSIKK